MDYGSSVNVASGPPQDRLARRLGLGDAVAIGLAAMVGAGVFAVWAPAAQAAGAGLLIGLAVAAFVAFANAGSTAQLAVQHPESGGAYRYGRERLGAWPGFLAGWSFVIGKTASCAAMALTAAAYLVPPEWQRPVAVAAVVVLVGVNLAGVTRTARVGAVLVTAVLVVLGIVVAAGVVSATGGGTAFAAAADEVVAPVAPGVTGTMYGILQSAALLFFAFAGYARIATLGEEVRHPARTIPRAIGLAFLIVVVVYAAVGAAALVSLGPRMLATSAAPLADVVTSVGWLWAEPVVRVAAGIAALGSLLVLIAGIARTGLAMARDGELPRPLAAVHPRSHVPHIAELAAGAAVIVLVLVADLRGAIGFSSFGVLLYYLVANLSAVTQPRAERRIPRWLSIAGAVGCLVLVVTLPLPSIVAGTIVLAVGALYRLLMRALRPHRAAPEDPSA